MIAPVPEDLRELYARIAKRHNGTAMAEARDGQCRGCGMRVLPHILQELRTETNEEVYRCESCGLILYTLEPIPVRKSCRRFTRTHPRRLDQFLMAHACQHLPRTRLCFPSRSAEPKTAAAAAYRANIDGGSRGNPGPGLLRRGHSRWTAANLSPS